MVESDPERVDGYLQCVSHERLPDEVHVLIQVGDAHGHVFPVVDQTQVVHSWQREEQKQFTDFAAVYGNYIYISNLAIIF